MLRRDNLGQSIQLAHQKDKLRHAWDRLAIEDVQADTVHPTGVHQPLAVTVITKLDGLAPGEVRVEAVTGIVSHQGELERADVVVLDHQEDLGDGRHRYAGTITPRHSGKYGFAVRIVPGGPMFNGPREPGLILWEMPATPPAPARPVVGHG